MVQQARTIDHLLKMQSMPDVLVSYAGRTFTAHVSRCECDGSSSGSLLILCFYENTKRTWLFFQVNARIVLEVLNRVGSCAVEIEKHCSPYDARWHEVS